MMFKRLLCKLLGHKQPLTLLPYERLPNVEGWTIERFQCERCKMVSRQLVAGELG